MNYVEQYAGKFRHSNPGLYDSIIKNADIAWEQYLSHFSFDNMTGLLMGNVQSGKTAQMFGIICRACEHGIPVFVLLTTDNIELQEQTFSRTARDLGDLFCVCGEQDRTKFEENALFHPVILVLKKNSRILSQWADILGSTGFMKGNSMMILDDEGDAASPNTKVNQNKQSAINFQLDRIRHDAMSTLYLEVTGTPQALILQSLESGWHPDFVQYFEPGRGYLGGNFFFHPANPDHVIEFTDGKNHTIRDSLIHYLVVTAQLMLSGADVSNALFHPGVRTESHDKIRTEIKKHLSDMAEFPEKYKDDFLAEWESVHPEKTGKLPFEDVFAQIRIILDGKISLITLNSRSKTADADYSRGCNIVIGGNTLGRGVTFPGLHTVYYSRTSKNPQMDTMWQHNRMFGYDRDPGLIRIWMSQHLFKLFCDINMVNNALIRQIVNGAGQIQILAPDGLKPTRKNVIDRKNTTLIPGGTSFFPFDPSNTDIHQLDSFLERFDEKEPYYRVSLRLIQKILEFIRTDDDFNIPAYKEALGSLLARNPNAQGVLIVRRNRNVTRGTGALLSSGDWTLAGSFPDETVLTLYKMSDEAAGWKQKGIWVPNFKLPGSLVFYSTKDR